MASEKFQQLHKVRSASYGNPSIGHRTIGKMWTGMIEQHFQLKMPHDIPAHIVALMLAAMKMNRACFDGVYQPDSYVDAEHYTVLAQGFDEERRQSCNGQ